MKRIIIFENLNITSLIVIFLIKFFFKKIYYRKKENYLKNKNFDNIIKKLNLEYLGLDGIDWSYCKQGFDIGKSLQSDLSRNYIDKNFLFNSFVSKYNASSEKLKLCLAGEIYNLSFEGMSLSLIKKNFLLEKNIIYYVPYYLSSYLLLKNHNKNLKVFSIIIIFKIFFSILEKVLTLLKKYINKKVIKNKKKISKNKNFDLKEFEIAYFPHQSIRYGKGAYSKTHIYEDIQDKKTFKSKILTILKEPVDKFSLRYFKFYNIPNVDINSIGFGFNIKKVFYFFNNFKPKSFSIFQIVLSYFILITIIQIEKNINLLTKLKKLKIIYCDYDVLFPKTILMACDIKKIKTISNQERYLVNFMMPPLFYNYYLVTGKNYEQFFKNSGYIVDKYFITGTFRNTKYLNDKKIKNRKEIIRLNKIKKKKILCLGTIIADKNDENLGEDGTTIENNVNFLTQIINLAKKFKNLHFIIRYKIDRNYDLLPKELLENIKIAENIELNKVENKINIYELVNLSSLIIGRYTSLIEESLSDGVDAIIYDEINFWGSASAHHPNSNILRAKNGDDLTKYINTHVKGGDLYGQNFKKELKNSFQENFKNETTKFKVQKILNELI